MLAGVGKHCAASRGLLGVQGGFMHQAGGPFADCMLPPCPLSPPRDKAVISISYDKSFPDDVRARAVEVKRAAWLNMAAAHLKLGAPLEAVKACDKVLDHDTHHVKALYRRAQAQAALGNLFEAECDVKKGLVQEPGNADLKALGEGGGGEKMEKVGERTRAWVGMLGRWGTRSSNPFQGGRQLAWQGFGAKPAYTLQTCSTL